MHWAVLLVFAFPAEIFRSSDSSSTEKRLEINGYLKTLESFSYQKSIKNSISGHLLHNRINLRWRCSERFRLTLAFRNRLFHGEETKLDPGFSGRLRNHNESLALEKFWIKESSLILHSNTERLNLAFRVNKATVTAGRQRINWGICTVWNPNDVFNAYSLLDFDYEERSGADALRMQYPVSNFAGMDAAIACSGKNRQFISAAKYQINFRGYDIQVNAGWYFHQFTAGFGWAGNIRDAGFRGEAQVFPGNQTSRNHLNLSLESDYVFASGWYLSAAYLYNSRGISGPVQSGTPFSFTISPENLMPTRHSFFFSIRKEITPMLSFGTSLLFAPGSNLFIVLPTLKYNLAANLDADLIWQSFFAEINQKFAGINHRAFLRIKWNF